MTSIKIATLNVGVYMLGGMDINCLKDWSEYYNLRNDLVGSFFFCFTSRNSI